MRGLEIRLKAVLLPTSFQEPGNEVVLLRVALLLIIDKILPQNRILPCYHHNYIILPQMRPQNPKVNRKY